MSYDVTTYLHCALFVHNKHLKKLNANKLTSKQLTDLVSSGTLNMFAIHEGAINTDDRIKDEYKHNWTGGKGLIAYDVVTGVNCGKFVKIARIKRFYTSFEKVEEHVRLSLIETIRILQQVDKL